jgi:hypothetical protein
MTSDKIFSYAYFSNYNQFLCIMPKMKVNKFLKNLFLYMSVVCDVKNSTAFKTNLNMSHTSRNPMTIQDILHCDIFRVIDIRAIYLYV